MQLGMPRLEREQLAHERVVLRVRDLGRVEHVVAVVVVLDFRAQLFGPNARRRKLGFARRIFWRGLVAVLGTHG